VQDKTKMVKQLHSGLNDPTLKPPFSSIRQSQDDLPTGTSWRSGVVKCMEATRPAPDLDNAWTCTRYVTPSSRSPILKLWTFC